MHAHSCIAELPAKQGKEVHIFLNAFGAPCMGMLQNRAKAVGEVERHGFLSEFWLEQGFSDDVLSFQLKVQNYCVQWDRPWVRS